MAMCQFMNVGFDTQVSHSCLFLCSGYSLFLTSSKRANDRVSEAKYPVLCKDGTDSPVVLGKIKRIKSMQPKPLEEEITKSLGK